MPYTLHNCHLEITVDLPSEGYKSSRFDYTGKITSVKFQDALVTGKEQLDAQNGDYLGKGLYNEFGIDSALGYNNTKKGDWFHKIGVGLLKKDDDTYQFNKNYEIRPANFVTQGTSDSISIICQSESINGYSYVLKKEMLLHENSFVIKYFLENTGIKDIDTTEYNHNFIAINNELIGNSYVLKFPFEIQPASFKEYVNSEKIVSFEQDSVSFHGNPNEQFFFSKINGGAEEVSAKWKIINLTNRIGISETGNFVTKKINLWGWKHVISPELFFDITLKSGEVTEWSRTYKFFEIT
jgi:hypothetical protein